MMDRQTLYQCVSCIFSCTHHKYAGVTNLVDLRSLLQSLLDSTHDFEAS